MSKNQTHTVASFQDLVSTPFQGGVNAMCWERNLTGDFEEIVRKVEFEENIKELSVEELSGLQLNDMGKLAREVLLNDLQLLKNHGASPVLNIIKYYDRDNAFPFFPTDVYSFHVDRSPIPVDTFLCTYHGESSEIIPNSQAEQKILIPEIREELKKLHKEEDGDFESFLKEHFFDLHYQIKSDGRPISLGNGHLWRLVIDHPEKKVQACVHRAPEEKGESRLMIIC